MTTIYVVTSGCYSDYGMNGMFSTKEKAEKFIKDNKTTFYDKGQIEEWILDEQQDHELRTVWSCCIDLRTGNITDEWVGESMCEDGYTHIDSYSPTAAFTGAHSATSLEHCRKLAAEVRQGVLRHNASKLPCDTTL